VLASTTATDGPGVPAYTARFAGRWAYAPPIEVIKMSRTWRRCPPSRSTCRPHPALPALQTSRRPRRACHGTSGDRAALSMIIPLLPPVILTKTIKYAGVESAPNDGVQPFIVVSQTLQRRNN
jgi:hypothetical protein